MRTWEPEANAAVCIAHISHRLGVSFEEAVLLIERATDRWCFLPSSAMIPPLLRGIIPVMEASVQVTITAEGRVTYQPHPRESSNEAPPETKLLPPDLVDTERYPV